MCRLLVCLSLVSLVVGCYPEPETNPVEPSPEHIERMQNAVHGDGTPIRKRPAGGRYGEPAADDQ